MALVKKSGTRAQRAPRDRDPIRRGREQVIAHRAARLAVREQTAHQQAIDRRERGKFDGPNRDQYRLLVQMRAANEQLVLATIRADELAEETAVSRAVIDDHALERRARKLANAKLLATLAYELRDPGAPIVAALNLMATNDPTAHARERAVIETQLRYVVGLVDAALVARDDGN